MLERNDRRNPFAPDHNRLPVTSSRMEKQQASDIRLLVGIRNGTSAGMWVLPRKARSGGLIEASSNSSAIVRANFH